MRRNAPPCDQRSRLYRALPAVWLAALPLDRAVAVDLPGLYHGAAVGRSQVKAPAHAPASDSVVNPARPGRFMEGHWASKVMAGLRPTPLLGAELAHIDLGHPGGHFGGLPADASMKGTAALGVLYLPLRSP